MALDPHLASELAKLQSSSSSSSSTSTPTPFPYKLQHRHQNWAKILSCRPALYLQPSTTAELHQIITLARRCHANLVPVGCGHSPNDLTMTPSWLLNLDHMSRILSVDQASGVVVMQAGIRLYQLTAELDRHALALPNLGSIDNQSIAGAIATGTHGSTLRHGTLSSSVLALKIMLSNGKEVACSPGQNGDLFSAALVSLGALGVITEITFQAVPAFNLAWTQTVIPLSDVLARWDADLWTQAEFVRVWWLPYTRRAILWHADKSDAPLQDPPSSWYGARFGRWCYEALLWLSNSVPSTLPFIERFIFGLQYGFRPGSKSSAVQVGHRALLMDCLYSQWVNEWALPLSRGPEALSRLSAWLNRLPASEHRIPIPILPSTYVHSPIEVRVSSTHDRQRGTLDFSCEAEPTLYLNATLYRPFLTDPPCRVRYYEAFEWLMRDLGGRPHWAKNFLTPDRRFFEGAYGERLERWRAVRREVDPVGMFAQSYHRRYLLAEGEAEIGAGEREEGESGVKDADLLGGEMPEEGEKGEVDLVSATSEESFDLMAKAEAG